jgi:prepilin-type N-terminal cleavage/methylation domain-containing protein
MLSSWHYAETMQMPRNSAGYTLIEVVIALLVFTVGALALAASSAIIAQAMATNAFRERAGRVAVSRIALIKSECRFAASGSEKIQQMESTWSVARADRSKVSVTESVSYASPRGSRTQSYRTTLWCPN